MRLVKVVITFVLCICIVACSDSGSGSSGGPPPPPTSPLVAVISPSGGPAAGGTPVTITGIRFQDGAIVTIGGTWATAIVFVDSTTITCITGPHIGGSADVTRELG